MGHSRNGSSVAAWTLVIAVALLIAFTIVEGIIVVESIQSPDHLASPVAVDAPIVAVSMAGFSIYRDRDNPRDTYACDVSIFMVRLYAGDHDKDPALAWEWYLDPDCDQGTLAWVVKRGDNTWRSFAPIIEQRQVASYWMRLGVE